jgi:hypothetical protein
MAGKTYHRGKRKQTSKTLTAETQRTQREKEKNNYLRIIR